MIHVYAEFPFLTSLGMGELDIAREIHRDVGSQVAVVTEIEQLDFEGVVVAFASDFHRILFPLEFELLLREAEACQPGSCDLPVGIVEYSEDCGGSIDIVHLAGFGKGDGIGVEPDPLIDNEGIARGSFLPTAYLGVGHVAIDAHREGKLYVTGVSLVLQHCVREGINAIGLLGLAVVDDCQLRYLPILRIV